MHDFLKPIFEFMEGNFVVINIIILYGVPSLIGFCGLLCFFFTNDFFDFVGRVLILLSAAACGVLAYYALINHLLFTSICGFVIAGSIVYHWLFIRNDSIKLRKKAKAGDTDALIKMGKEHFIRDKNLAAKYFEQAAEKGSPEAQYRLGKVYYEFLGKEQEGIEWFKKAAAQNYQYAVDKLNNIDDSQKTIQP